MTVWKSGLWGGYGREMSVVITTHFDGPGRREREAREQRRERDQHLRVGTMTMTHGMALSEAASAGSRTRCNHSEL